MNNASPRAGWIGLGAMGYHMAGHLAVSGCLARVWNRSTTSAEKFAGQFNVEISQSPAALVEDLDVIFLCVSNDESVSDLVAQMQPGLKSGAIVIDTSTVSPATATTMSEQLLSIPVHWIDAPVSGGVEGARKGSLAVMAGGDPAIFERILPLLEVFGDRATYMGPVGSGQAAKAINQVMVAGIAETVCEALAFAEQLNLPRKRLITVLSSGAANSWFLEHRGKTMLADKFEPGFKSALLLKDLGICTKLAHELNSTLPVTELALRDYNELVAAGDGDNDTSSLIKLKRSLIANKK